MRNSLLSALRFAGFFLGAAAFTFAAGADEKPADASFRFLCFSELPPLCAKDTHGKYVPVETHTNFIGRPVRLATKDGVALTPCDDKGEPLKQGGVQAAPLGMFNAIPGTPRQFVLLFSDKKKISAHVIPDTVDKFPFGRVLAVNLTGVPLRMEYGNKTNNIPATGAFLCAEPKSLIGESDASVRITTASEGKKVIYSTVWPHYAKVRTLAFIYKNEAGRIIVRTVSDADVPELAEAKPDAGKGDKNGKSSAKGPK